MPYTHEQVVAAWQGLNNDPRFAELPYDEQQKIRAQWAQKNLILDPSFTTLDAAGQNRIFQNMVTQPPSFVETDAFTDNALRVAQGVRQGNSDALNEASLLISEKRLEQNIAGPIIRPILRLEEAISPTLRGRVPVDLTADQRKAATYLEQQFKAADDKTFWQAALPVAAPFLGIAGNIVSGRIAFAPMLAMAKTAGAVRAARATTRLGTWLSRSVLPEVFESSVDATMMAAADYYSKQLTQSIPFGIDTKSTFGNLALNFGANFVGDLVFFGAASFLGTALKAGAKALRPRGFAARAVKNLSEPEWSAMINQFIKGENLPKGVFDSLPRETQQSFLRLRRAFAAANLESADPADVARMTALRRGYDMIATTDGGIRLQPVVSKLDNIPGQWASENDALLGLFKAQNVPTAQSTKIMDAVLTNEAGIEAVSKFDLGDAVPELETQTLARAFVPDANGQINPHQAQVATRSLLQKAGVDADALNKAAVKQIPAEAYWKLTDNARAKYKSLLVPDAIRTAEEMASFTQKYSDDVRRLIPEGVTARNAEYVTDVFQAATAAPVPTNPAFVEADAIANGMQLEYLANGGYRVDGQMFSTLDDAAQYINHQSIFSSEDSIRKAFGEQFNMAFVQDDSGRWLARGTKSKKGGNIFTGSHDTIEGAADELYAKGFRPRLGQDKALNVVINAEGTGVEVGQGVIRGPLEYINDYAKRFKPKTSNEQILKTFGTDTVAKGTIKNTYRVTSPTWGVVKEFTSYKKAVDFLAKQRNTVDDLLEVAFLKGVPKVDIRAGRIVAQTVDSADPVAFDSVKRFKEWLQKRVPSPEWQKEISNMDSGMLDSVWDQIPDDAKELFLSKTGTPRESRYSDVLRHMEGSPTWKEGGYIPKGEYGKMAAYRGAGTGIAQFIKDAMQTPTYARVRRVVGQTGRDWAGRSFEAMEKNIKNARALTAQTSELLHGITAFEGAPKAKRRAVIRPLLEVGEHEWDAKAAMLKIDLTDTDRRYLQRFRQASKAIGDSFGIDPYRMISYHLPRIAEFMDRNPEIVRTAHNAHEILGRMDSRLAKELEFFSEYLRADELSTFVAAADPQEILASYVRKGVKNMTLGKTYENIVAQLNDYTKQGQVTPDEFYTMQAYLKSVMGMYSDEASKAAEMSARETGSILAQRLGAKANTQAFKDYINTLHGFTIAATMSFRPWPVIRNLQQVWTTLAPMFGNDSVMRALKVMGNETEATKVYQRLLRSGRLQDRIPIYGGVYEATGKMGLINKFGMKLYKNSDDYTRMVVDIVVRDTFTDAVAKLDSGILKNEKQFIRLANLHRLDDFDQRRIMELLRGYTDDTGRQIAGSFEKAVDYYGDIVTRETMFAYTAGANPMMFNGMWGRLFGMFGHYPVYYAQTLINGLRRGNLVDKAIFAGRVAFNTAALWFTFDKVLGVKADNFVPWKTMFFEGGPYFNLLADSLKTFAGSPGAPTWPQLRRDFAGLFVPGSLQIKAIHNGLDLMAAGQGYQGFLKLMSAPLAD